MRKTIIYAFLILGIGFASCTEMEIKPNLDDPNHPTNGGGSAPMPKPDPAPAPPPCNQCTGGSAPMPKD